MKISIYSEKQLSKLADSIGQVDKPTTTKTADKERRSVISMRAKDYDNLLMYAIGGDRELMSYFVKLRKEAQGGKNGYNTQIINLLSSAVITDHRKNDKGKVMYDVHGNALLTFKKAPHFAFVAAFVRSFMSASEQVKETQTGAVNVLPLIKRACQNARFASENRTFSASELLALFAGGKLTKKATLDKDGKTFLINIFNKDVTLLDVKASYKSLLDTRAKFGDVIPA